MLLFNHVIIATLCGPDLRFFCIAVAIPVLPVVVFAIGQ